MLPMSVVYTSMHQSQYWEVSVCVRRCVLVYSHTPADLQPPQCCGSKQCGVGELHASYRRGRTWGHKALNSTTRVGSGGIHTHRPPPRQATSPTHTQTCIQPVIEEHHSLQGCLTLVLVSVCAALLQVPPSLKPSQPVPVRVTVKVTISCQMMMTRQLIWTRCYHTRVKRMRTRGTGL